MAKKVNERMRIITLQRNELETVFASMTEMVLAVDTEKRILRINRSAAALFYHVGIENPDLSGTVETQ